MVDTEAPLGDGDMTIPELAVLWASTLRLTLNIRLGARYSRWFGAIMVAAYAAFIVSEFTLVNRVADFDAFAGSDQKTTWEGVQSVGTKGLVHISGPWATGWYIPPWTLDWLPWHCAIAL